jgi:hypothetical protein
MYKERPKLALLVTACSTGAALLIYLVRTAASAG